MSSHKGKTLIVIPAYNEEDSLPRVLKELNALKLDLDVVVINDGSNDQTATVAKMNGAEVISMPFNTGVGGAMRTGYKYAHQNDYFSAIQLDADGQHNPSDIPRLLNQLKDYNIVIGARFAGEGDYKSETSRRVAMKVLAHLLSKIVKTKLTDTTSGYRATDRKAIEFFASNYPSEYLGDTIEALVSAHKVGLTITQIPVSMRARFAGNPSQSWRKSVIHLTRSLVALSISLTRKPASRNKEA